jgi:hypothetical protein
MWSGRVVQPDQVLRILQWEGSSSWQMSYSQRLFKSALETYLQGKGHPQHSMIEQLVTKHRMNADSESSTLRAELFLAAATGSKILPCQASGKIRVRPSIRLPLDVG